MTSRPAGKACFNVLMAACVAALVVTNGSADAQPAKATDWQDWGGDAARTHFSPLQQITAANVSQLKPAWVWDSGKFGRSWEITPLLIDGLLIVSEPGTTDVVALEPESGKEIWRHKAPGGGVGRLDRRGFAYWAGDGQMKPRIVVLWGHNMYGLDPMTGESASDWPATGYGIGLPNPAAPETGGGGVFPASPPIIYKNLIIVSGASGFLPEPAQPADPHAIDLRTDTMSPPVPVEITKDGKKIKVIVQTTKQGMMWIIDDKTGKPLFPYEERPVPQSEVPGEKTARTQPFTLSPPPLAQMTISRDNLSNLSPHSNADCKAVWDQNGLKEGGPFLPPAKNGAWTVMNTGAIGGINWGGASIDVDRGYAITNVVNMPTMIQVTEGPKAVKGNDSYIFSSGYKRFSDSDGRTCAGGRQWRRGIYRRCHG